MYYKDEYLSSFSGVDQTMQDVQEYIEKKKQEFARNSFFCFLKSDAPILKKLEWAFPLSFFAMSFKDINEFGIRGNEEEGGFLQKILNQHSEEDSKHWRWFLADLKKIGHNPDLSFVQSLNYLWGEESTKARLVCYNLFALLLNERDLHIKLCVVEAIEATGVVALPIMADLGEEYEREYGVKLAYFSSAHAKVETGHIISQEMDVEQTEKYLASIVLTEEQRERAMEAVDKVFHVYEELMNSMPRVEDTVLV